MKEDLNLKETKDYKISISVFILTLVQIIIAIFQILFEVVREENWYNKLLGIFLLGSLVFILWWVGSYFKKST
jgi:hypothetical protein